MLLARHVLRIVTVGLLVAVLCGCAGEAQPRDDAEVVAALRETLGRLGTRDGEAFRAGFTARGFEDFTHEWWGVTGDLEAAGLDLDTAVAGDAYRSEAANVASGSESRVEVHVREQGRPDLSQDRFVLVRSKGRWLIDGVDRGAASPPVPAGYLTVPVEVREYAIDVADSLPSLPRATAFVARNDGNLEHDIALLWLDGSVPTEGFFFGVAEAWPPMLDFYGSIRVAPGETGRLIPRQLLEHLDGRYVLFCTIGERGPSHARLGMLVELEPR